MYSALIRDYPTRDIFFRTPDQLQPFRKEFAMDISKELSRTAKQISDGLKSVFPGVDSDYAELLTAEIYSLLAGGKRIRPFLVLKTCSLFGGNEANALPLAYAIEMVHTYSLIHDDLPCMDNDILRRGQPTCHVKFSESTALLAGDGLLTRAFETIATADSLSAECRVAAVRVLSEAAGDSGMLAGQMMDIRAESERPTEEILLKLHLLKTGAMIRAACLLGVIAAEIIPSKDDPRVKAILAYSEAIGLAFQVIDDILDQTGDEALLGKPLGSDAAEGKTTFLSFMSVEDAERYAVELTDRAVTAISDYDHDGVLSALAYYLCDRKN